MARDLAEQEREFVEQLAADTGRDLASWMTAIRESGQDSRNAIIDWLRQQGFAFPKASWLERIHHNGGHLIYGADGPTASDFSKNSDSAKGKTESGRTERTAILPPVAADVAALTRTEVLAEDVSALLAGAKGLRPLAELVAREIVELVPSARIVAAGTFVNFGEPSPFAALLPQHKDLRLFANFGPAALDRTRKVDGVRFGTSFPEVLLLSDARLVDERFREIVAEAYRRSLT